MHALAGALLPKTECRRANNPSGPVLQDPSRTAAPAPSAGAAVPHADVPLQSRSGPGSLIGAVPHTGGPRSDSGNVPEAARPDPHKDPADSAGAGVRFPLLRLVGSGAASESGTRFCGRFPTDAR